MKVVFITTTLIGLIYLVLQSSAGTQWLAKFGEDNLVAEKVVSSSDMLQHELGELEQRVALLATQQVAKLTQSLQNTNDKLLAENADLLARVAELEKASGKQLSANHSDTQIANKAEVSKSNNRHAPQGNVTSKNKLQTQSVITKVNQTKPDEKNTAVKSIVVDSAAAQRTQNSLNQAKLQDVIARMEMASLALLSR